MKQIIFLRKLGVIIYLGSVFCWGFKANAAVTPEEALKLATEAYIYGYPLVTMDMTEKVTTNVKSPGNFKAPIGQFANLREFPNASFKDVTTPNADTLYSSAWLDLTKEPYILHLPDMGDRYYLMPILNAWTDVFADPGSRTTGSKEQNIAITGPGWKGELPKGLTATYKSPTNTVWIIGRTYCTGTPKDFSIVHSLQEQYKLTPLSAYGQQSYTPPEGNIDPNIDQNKPVRDQVNALDAKTFFSRLAALMQANPPAKEDEPMVKRFAQIGIIPGKEFDTSGLSNDVVKSIESSVKVAQEQIVAHEKTAGMLKNGWSFPLKVGNYGTDYLERAYIAAFGLGANKPQDAIYPTTNVDSDGNTLNGQNRYVIHFEKGQMPPVKGFWSITMYNKNYFFIQNPLNRVNLGTKDSLKKNDDGSMDLYIQHDFPGADKESNWLPAPTGEFALVLRLYWPSEAILNGKWNPPAVTLVK